MKDKKDELGNRMKEYESVTKNYLVRRIPVIIRIDGKAFHQFCKRFERPYDSTFNSIMNNVMVMICSNTQGIKFSQRHSDEISFVLTDYDTITTDAFFDYNVQKMVSVIAGMASAELCRNLMVHSAVFGGEDLLKANEKWPCFDCRCFNIPEKEISNYLWWRILDCKRNSISMLAQSKFSHKELQGKNCNEMQEMTFAKFGINWAKLPQEQKSGFICYKQKISKQIEECPMKGKWFDRNGWVTYPAPAKKENLNIILKDALEGNTTILESESNSLCLTEIKPNKPTV